MKKVIQNLNSGSTTLVETPVPQCGANQLLIETRTSLISIGTERMLVEFGRGNLLDKVRQQPDKVKDVVQKVRADGLASTYEAVQAKLDQPIALGYCNAGVVREVGSKVYGFAIGDRVISNGSHAEFVTVPSNLCAKIPENVTDEQASFTVAASIGLQGVRLAQPSLGEYFVVIGLGLIGLLSVQLLRANGCKVLGIDFDPVKCDLARQFGAEALAIGADSDPVAVAQQFSAGNGVDGVIITASTKSSEPMTQAARMCRKRGRVILVGVIGGEWNRSDFYEKEISFQVSCSYGPGRYEQAYEEQGLDYPIGFVRWTEQRNFCAVLQLMSDGSVNPSALISHRFDFADSEHAYDHLTDNGAMGIVLSYPSREKTLRRNIPLAVLELDPSEPIIAVLGAGNFTSRTLLPILKNSGAQLHTLVSESGLSGTHSGNKFGFGYSSTDSLETINNPAINTVFITTQHNNHAELVVQALQANKHVFVEKPLAISHSQLDAVEHALKTSAKDKLLMVGFNRRFSPFIADITTCLRATNEPLAMIMTVNAGEIPASHWTQDPELGGGRIIGEACHFIDLLRHLAGSPIESAQAHYLDSSCQDTASIQLTFANGSIGTVHYFANGHKSLPKEKLEIFSNGKVIEIDNFRTMKTHGWSGLKSRKLHRQDKGHKDEILSFLNAIKHGKSAPIAHEELLEVTRQSINISPRKT